MNIKHIAACVVFLTLPLHASAADIPVSYLVDGRALKDAVAGTTFTFGLYSDSSCTTLLDSQLNLVEDLAVLGLKRFKPSGATTPPPKTAEIRNTITGVTASGHFYLKVTGTGVTPVGGACQAQAAIGDIPPTCNDNIQNQGESDTDCGGSVCTACGEGDSCGVNGDCQSQSCSGGVCVASCFDNLLNQDETDIDCGGSICDDCPPGSNCLSNNDCAASMGLVCLGGACQSHCGDGLEDGDETDVDCGGFECGTPCNNGQGCDHGSDCNSNNCLANICQP